MTTDTTALQERIARAIRLADTGDTLPDGFAARMWDEGVTNRDKEMRLAAAVLPIIAAEVRKAQADTLRDAAESTQPGVDMNPTTTNGNWDYMSWTRYLAGLDSMWRSRLQEAADRIEQEG